MTAQPDPRPNASTPIIDLVLRDIDDPDVAADFRARAEQGLASYGVYLQAHNGRDAVRDAYDEAIDLVMYLRQALEEVATNGERAEIELPYANALRVTRMLQRRIAWRDR